MITTDHQYRVTAEKLSKFRAALKSAKSDENSPEPLQKQRVRAIVEQISALESEQQEYDELRSGHVDSIQLETLADLPQALVKARIARGLSQSALAELLNVKPQQVQRWEADGYSRVGFDHLKRIAGALRVSIPDRIKLSGDPPVAPSELRRAMVAAGFSPEVYDRAILPRSSILADDLILADEIDARVRAIFGFSAAALRSANAFGQVALRFKLPASANQERTRAYAVYVDGLCSLAAKCLPHKTSALPKSWNEMRSLLFPDGRPSLRAAVEACWSFGIAVLALEDPVAFHGACWRRGGRTVMVLKQPIRDEFRWLFDLVHELFHAVAAPAGDFTVIELEETSPAMREGKEEKRANRYAAEVLTNGRLRELTEKIVQRAGGFVPRLKAATVEVAEAADLPVGLVANLLARRLAEDPNNESWWATAASLQQSNGTPWKIVRDVFLERARFDELTRVERDVIHQLMETSNG